MRHNYIDFLEEKKRKENRKLKRLRRFFVLSIFVMILLFTGCIAQNALNDDISNNPIDYDPISLDPKRPGSILGRLKQLVFHKDIKLKGYEKDRVNLLLLGMGGVGHDGGFLTDTIMLASIKPSTNQISMISIPRDLGVDIPGYGMWKINHANAFGEENKNGWGGTFAAKVFEETFDIDIHYYGRVDFQAFEEIIDEVGGVKINVEKSFVDASYPDGNDGYQVVSFKEGVQKMDGDKALKYSRSRHGNNGEGSDFARAYRQQKVMLALKEKLLSFGTLMNPIRINKIIESLDTHITTNMEFGEIVTLAKMTRDLNTDSIITVVLDNSENGYLRSYIHENGAYMLAPVTGDFKEINGLIKNVFETNTARTDDTPRQDRYSLAGSDMSSDLAEANIEIQNGTWNAGLAARIEKSLKDDGFYVTKIGNTSERPIAKSGIYIVGKEKFPKITEVLLKKMDIKIYDKKPENIDYNNSTDILVIIGEDFSE